MRQQRAAVLAALFIWLFPILANAQDITLRSRDGAIELSGTLLGFDGEFYRLRTQYGEMTVDGSGVLCEGVGCPSLTDYVAELTIAGSATVGRVLMPALLEGFARRNSLRTERTPLEGDNFLYTIENPRTQKIVGRFAFRITNSDEGFADLLADSADVVMSLREIRPTETALAKEAGLGDLSHPKHARVLALDALMPIVSARNPVNTLSLADLTKILTGEVTNWEPLGGPDAPISLHLRDAQSGIAQDLEDRFLTAPNVQLAPTALRHDSNQALADAVDRDPFGLGIASFSEVGNAKPLVLSGPCGFQLRAARRSIKTEDYPLTAPMFLYMPARRLPALARDFLAYTRSDTAQIVVRRAGFVDQAAEEVAIDLQGNRLANAITVAEDAEALGELRRMGETLSRLRRLSLSFRFEPGATRLDAHSRSNVEQLALALATGVYNGRELVFVGFSDGEGASAGNLKIAAKRANAVRDAVELAAEGGDLSQVSIKTDAFGEAMPMACDTTEWGRQINRRVEIWVR
ncbi:MAG: substrate-binding domain-containing protein [Pelagimonas sp.]